MKAWLKQQVTELTAWAGLYIIFTGFVNLPYWLDVAIGVMLISTDDIKASNLIKSVAPRLQKKIDEV